MILSKILDAISTSIIRVEVRESDAEVFLKFRINGLSIDRKKLSENLGLIHERDSFIISISHDHSDQSTVLAEKASQALDEFCEKLQLWDDTDGVVGVITLRVIKSSVARAITIYSLDAYGQYLSAGSVGDVLGRFSSLASVVYTFDCNDLGATYKTQRFIFRPYGGTDIPCTNPEPVTRPKRLAQRDKVCSIYGSNSETFLPDDFKFDSEFPHSQISELFQRLALLHALISLSDVSKFEPSGAVTITMKGYRNVKLEISSLDRVKMGSEGEYYSVFDWVYTDGNIVDKSGIARNLISIHVIDDDMYRLKPGCLESIASNYVIYLKDNLKQYIDVKNKLSEQIQKTSEKASEVVKSINSYLRASIFSVYSFVFSVFLIRTVGKSDGSPLFSNATYALFILFVLVSILVLGYALAETNAETRRFRKIYEAFRQRYTDLITKEDLNKIFHNDTDFNRDIEYIRKARRKLVVLWVSSLALIFSIVTFVKYNENESAIDLAAEHQEPGYNSLDKDVMRNPK